MEFKFFLLELLVGFFFFKFFFFKESWMVAFFFLTLFLFLINKNRLIKLEIFFTVKKTITNFPNPLNIYKYTHFF